MKYSFLLLFWLIFGANLAFSQVWIEEEGKVWDEKMEKEYRSWAKNFKADTFSSSKSKYCGINVDCADMIYSQRIIFAFENKLPFKFLNNAGGSPKYITNQNKRGNKADKKDDDEYFSCMDEEAKATLYETHSDEEIRDLKRLKEFIVFYKDAMLSTYTLAFNDTLPVKPEEIISGDTYVSPLNGDFHSYLIQNANIKGYFDMLYATQKEYIAPLNIVSMNPKNFPDKIGWGFKRFIKPDLYEKTEKIKKITNIEKANTVLEKNDLLQHGYSFDQYNFLGSNYFNEIKKRIGMTATEEIAEKIERRIKNVCTMLKSRNSVIEDILMLKEEKNSTYFNNDQCLKVEYFRKHSTPSRDATTMMEIETLFREWELHLLNLKEPVDLYSHRTIVPWLMYNHSDFKKTRNIEIYQIDQESRLLEERLCEIDIKTPEGVVKFHISDFIKRYTTKRSAKDPKGNDVWVSLLSSNPNDSVFGRWGLNGIIERTDCPNYDEKGELIEKEEPLE